MILIIACTNEKIAILSRLYDVAVLEPINEHLSRVSIKLDNATQLDSIQSDSTLQIEAILDHAYCLECSRLGIVTRLQANNSSGYCYRHRDKSPERSYQARYKTAKV